MSFELTRAKEGCSFRTCSLAKNISWFLQYVREKNEYFTFKGDIYTTICYVFEKTHVATLSAENTRKAVIVKYFKCWFASFMLEKFEVLSFNWEYSVDI